MSGILGSAHPAFAFGGVTIAGGVLGFVRKGSKPSLAAGVVCGSLLIASGVMISKDSQLEGHQLAGVTSSVMTVAMGHRFFKTGKFMPAGLVSVLAAVSSAYHAKKAMEWAE